MVAGFLVTTGVGWWISSLSTGSLERVSGLLFPVLIGQLVLALAFGFLLRRMPATLGLGLFFLYAAATGVSVGVVLLLYPLTSVVAAGSGAAALAGGAALYAMTTKRDLTQLGTSLVTAQLRTIAATP